MSVTPTKDALIVALDFEGRSRTTSRIAHCASFRHALLFVVGVHSIERSAQEDALLVLFNTAISNLVSRTKQHGPREVEMATDHVSCCRCYSATISRSVVTLLGYFNHSSRVLLCWIPRRIRHYSSRRWSSLSRYVYRSWTPHQLRRQDSSEACFLADLGCRRLGQGRNRQRVGHGCSSCFRAEPFTADVFSS
jgi:hypothetical protein